jgi:hypothetical protein
MAVVIPLAPRLRAQNPEAPATPRHEPAAILFFTGVRYEREIEPPVPEPTGRRARRVVATAPAGRPKRPKKATTARQPA